VTACALHAVMLHTQFNSYLVTSALKCFLFLLCPLAYFRISGTGSLGELVTGKANKQQIKQSAIIALLTIPIILLVFIVLRSLLDPKMIADALSNVGITGINYFFVFVYVVLINAGIEELFFRGFVFLCLYRAGCKKYAYLYSAFLFALYHVSVIRSAVTPGLLLLAVVGLFFGGLVLNLLAKRCDSILGSLVVHICINLAINTIGVYYLYFAV